MGLMALTAGGDEPKSAEFEPPETLYNGAFTRSFDLEVPPLFELTPRLRLGYNSGDNRQHSGDGFSLLGVGWTLSGGGLIERKSSRGGLPKFDATDKFELDGNGLLDCVVDGVTRDTPSCSAGGTHTARYETYERIKKVAADNSWQVTARDGSVSTYRPLAYFAPSGTEDTRLRNDYRWLLQAVTDTDGNVVTYSYDCAALPTCYVSTISYGVSTIQFYWETRTDSFTHATGISLASVTKRLKTVAARNSGALIRAYDLAYTYSPDTKRSLLASFKQYGSDATVSGAGVISGGTSLPPDTFTYWDMSSRRMGTMISDVVTANTAVEMTPSTTATEPVPNTSGGRLGDFDGNGMPDVAVISGCGVTLALNTKSAAGVGVAVPGNPSSSYLNTCANLGGHWVGDFNGDGRDDIGLLGIKEDNVKQPYKDQLTAAGYGWGDTFVLVLYLDGLSFVGASISGVYDGKSGGSPDATVGDFTGDGIADAMYRSTVLRSTGSGFVREAAWVGATSPVSRVGDFNGDGIADVFEVDSSPRMLYSTGSSFAPISMSYPGVIGDFNGDGVTDFTRSWNPYSRNLATGNGFTVLTWPYEGDIVGAGDINGDGDSELATVIGAQPIYIHIDAPNYQGEMQGAGDFTDYNGDGKADAAKKDSVVPDLLKRHTLGTGGTVDVEFLPSSYWTNGYLPFIVQAVSKVTTADGRGNSSKVKYAYEGGAYDAFERKFLGFAKVTAELPCEVDEATCPWVHAWYRQEAVAAGSLSKLEVYAPNGQVQRRVENGYVVNQTSAPFSAFKTSEQVTDFLAGGNPVTRKEWTYDGYANLVEEKDLGVVGWTDDDLATSTSYELNLGAYIVDRPSRVTASSAAGTLLRDTQVFYDGASTAGVEPTKGHATTTRKWLASESRWVAASAEYDSYGQPTAETDPLGNRSERLYDATHQFVVEERNPLWFDGDTRQRQLASWHALCSAPLTQTDGNDLVTAYQYDALCRQTRVDYPSGEYLTTAFFNLGTATTQVGSPGTELEFAL